MNFKKQIERLLKLLKDLGYDRDKIERDLGYRENYIDQNLSRGGNQRFVNNLKNYYEKILLGAIKDSDENSILAEDEHDYKKDVEKELLKKRVEDLERILQLERKLYGKEDEGPNSNSLKKAN